MNKYDKIFESLQERLNSGSITEESAKILNDICYNKFVVEEHTEEETTDENAEVTLEDAMNAINDILTEKENAVVEESQETPAVAKREFTVPETTQESTEEPAIQPKRELVAPVEESADDTEVITEESVKEMRYRVYEAATKGLISEDEKLAYLDKLVF